MIQHKNNLIEIFEHQIHTLLEKKYPDLAGISKEEFLSKINGLRSEVEKLSFREVDLEKGFLPFVIVVKHTLVSTEKAMSVVEKQGNHGITKLFPKEPKDFLILDSVDIPDKDIYLLTDIDRGKETLNITPYAAYIIIKEQSRSPLTIDEGIALVTHYPDFLVKNNCFSLLASRCPADKKVPAIWINGAKQPNLGWCWEGNPHTWLGSASCKNRI